MHTCITGGSSAIYIYIYMCVCVCVCVHACIYIYVCIYIYIYIYIVRDISALNLGRVTSLAKLVIFSGSASELSPRQNHLIQT